MFLHFISVLFHCSIIIQIESLSTPGLFILEKARAIYIGPDTRYNLGSDLLDTIHWIQLSATDTRSDLGYNLLDPIFY